MKRKLNVKLVAGLALGLAVTAVIVHFVHGYQVQQNAYRLLERADRAAESKDFDRALTYYAQYLVFVPDDADTVQKYAEALDRGADTVGERVRVVLLMEQVLRVKPREDALRLRLVTHLIVLDRLSEAIDNLRKLERTWPDRADILHKLGWCLEAKKEYTHAIRSFEEALRVNPKQLKTYPVLVEVLDERLARVEEARKVMDDMVRENPDAYQAYLARARFLRRRGDDRNAQADLDHAYKIAGSKAEVIFALADAAHAKGAWGEAQRLLKDGLQRFPNQADFYRMLADVQLRNRQDDAALRSLEQGIARAPKSPELAVMLIDLMIDRKQYADAKTKIDELRQTGIRVTLPNYLTARLKIAEARWQEAIQLLESVREELGAVSDWHSRVHVLLGVAYRNVGDHERELQAFQRAVQDEPGWVTANLGLGEAYLNNGRIDDAAVALEPLRNAKDLPAGYWILLSRARLYRQMRLPEAERNWSDVDSAINRAAEEKDAGLAVTFVRAELLAARKDYAAAEKLLARARLEHPGDATIWCALADLAARQDRLDDADKILADAVQHDALKNAVELRLAQCRLWASRLRGEDQSKLVRLADWAATVPPEPRSRLQRELADTWHRLGAWDRADNLWRDLAQDWPRDVRSRFALLELALRRQQLASAEQWRDELRKIEGDGGSLWRYGEAAILVQQANRRNQLDDARKKLQELEQKQKNWPRIAVLLGTISEREGKYQQAIAEYSRALQLGETQPEVVLRLLELLQARREFSKAETELSRYEERMPLSRDLARVGAEIAVGLRDAKFAKIALKRAERAVTLPTRDYRDALWLARIYQEAGESAKSAALLRSTLAEAGHAPGVWLAWMEHLGQSQQREQGLRDLEQMKKQLSPRLLPLTLARSYEALFLPEQAEAAYQQATRDEPSESVMLAYAADFYRRAERTSEAKQCYERLLDPALAAPSEDIVKARRHLAILLAKSDRPRATELLDANKRQRGDTLADERVRLFLQSQTASNREAAIGKFEDTLRVQLPSSDERVLFAEMLAAAGYVSQARAQLAESVAEEPMSAFLVARYVRILIRAGAVDDARQQVDRLETLEPKSARVRELQHALSSK